MMPGEAIRLDLGSGDKQYLAGGFIVRVDLRPVRGVNVVADIRRLPFRNGIADECFSLGFLEHFDSDDAAQVLKECHRVLKNGGIARMGTTSLRSVAAAYLRGEIDFERARSMLYGYSLKRSREKGYEYENRHLCVFDEEWFRDTTPEFIRIERREFSPPAHDPRLLAMFELTKAGSGAAGTPLAQSSAMMRFFRRLKDFLERKLHARRLTK